MYILLITPSLVVARSLPVCQNILFYCYCVSSGHFSQHLWSHISIHIHHSLKCSFFHFMNLWWFEGKAGNWKIVNGKCHWNRSCPWFWPPDISPVLKWTTRSSSPPSDTLMFNHLPHAQLISSNKHTIFLFLAVLSDIWNAFCAI